MIGSCWRVLSITSEQKVLRANGKIQVKRQFSEGNVEMPERLRRM
jgi:hypothetical protein